MFAVLKYDSSVTDWTSIFIEIRI